MSQRHMLRLLFLLLQVALLCWQQLHKNKKHKTATKMAVIVKQYCHNEEK